MRRDVVRLWAPAFGTDLTVIAYGGYGRPVLAFPSEGGHAHDYEDNGMVGAVSGLIDAGRVKLYCVDSADAATWSDRTVPLEERARRHAGYESWLLDAVCGFIDADCGGRQEVVATGCSLGAFHAANLTLRRADRFPLAICQSGVYDPSLWAWGERGDAAYFNTPMDYVANADGGHLDWLRQRVSLLLVCGQGQWEDTTRALESTRALADLLGAKGIRHELDLWGYDVPHDWPSWRAQIAHHLPRFC